MGQHRGEIVEIAVRNSGFQFKKVAKMLGISRNTLYNRFSSPNLSDQFVAKVGRLIHHDFLKEIPDLDLKGVTTLGHENEAASSYYKSPDFKLLRELEIKYNLLLENYNKLLKILVELANSNDYASVREEIAALLKNAEEDHWKK